MKTYLTFVHALSPLHAGTGQGVGVIDLPIAREKATDLPYLPGSSVKGTLRDGFDDAKEQRAIFGSSEELNGEIPHAGSIQFSDQRLLLVPIRSMAGTFAWVTSPYLLSRFARDVQDCGTEKTPSIPDHPEIGRCFVAEPNARGRSALICEIGSAKKVILEDLDLDFEEHDAIRAWAKLIGEQVFPGDSMWQTMLALRLCVVHDDVLRFLLETATEVTARIRLLPDTKTVDEGGLWYEEALPTETILSGLLALTPTRQAMQGRTAQGLLDAVVGKTGNIMQFGGKATVGRGLCRVRIATNGNGAAK